MFIIQYFKHEKVMMLEVTSVYVCPLWQKDLVIVAQLFNVSAAMSLPQHMQLQQHQCVTASVLKLVQLSLWQSNNCIIHSYCTQNHTYAH